ncbi:hypothetical protein [Actinopolymorpha pittospori]|uniref:Uncharacterized protein n=1 Tax=Actinopolymorpha pittospori TaxID=648752 RepID=A0A927MQ90_9ACTN|nr:hypothetical protein [Actinopolymorpha pittospori]MBE1604689.1 hypothetical protein [Actinopolymorpha pittospori]
MTRVSNEVESLADASVERGGAALLTDVPDAVDVPFPAETATRWVRRHHAALFRYHDPRRRVGGC